MSQVQQYPGEFILETGNTPSICMVLPFEPQVNSKASIEGRLKQMVAKVESRLLQKYSTHKALPVLTKLQQLISGINYYHYKKSIALLISPYTAKVLYLDFPVTELFRIGEYLDIRDVVRAKSQASLYLVMVLGVHHAQLYVGTATSLSCIKYNLNTAAATSIPAGTERTGLSPDPSCTGGAATGKFLRRLDQGLGLVLNAYPLPVFILGEKEQIDAFRQLTAHREQIVAYHYGHFDTSTETDILMTLQPDLHHWQKNKYQLLLQQLDKAKQDGTLSCGVKAVWNTATHKRGRLLVVEETLISILPGDTPEGTASSFTRTADDPYYMKDLVDDIIEKVLKDGGDVEFVEKGILTDYQQIALIEHRQD